MDYGPPETVVEAGVFQHPCEGEVVCKLTNAKVRGSLLVWVPFFLLFSSKNVHTD